jgi:hypothetical protein
LFYRQLFANQSFWKTMQDSLIYNPRIAHFNPVQAPEAVEFWPVTIGWYLLAGLLILLIALLVYLQYRRWRHNQYRREALHALRAMEAELLEPDTRQSAIVQLSELLKRVALKVFPRERVASLTGEEWLAFLSQTGRNTNFMEDAGKLLLEAPYQSSQAIQSLPEDRLKALIALARKWMGGHRV